MKLYSSPFSELLYMRERRLLLASWSESSKDLGEDEVKGEINKIIDYVREYQIRNIIVDTRNYFFKDNVRIQNWINYDYVPKLMESGVTKYAIVVKSDIKLHPSDEKMEGILPVVEYFSSLEEALQWI